MKAYSSALVKPPGRVSLGAWTLGTFVFQKWNPKKADWLSSNVGHKNYEIERLHKKPYGWRIDFAKKGDAIQYKLVWGDSAETELH